MRVLLIGSYPPPLGGVGVFVSRYERKLTGEGHAVTVVDPHRFTKLKLYRTLVAARGYDLVSLNFPSFHMMMLLLATARAPQTEVWDHNWRVLEEWSAARRRLYQTFLRRARRLVLVAPHIADYYRAHGVEPPARTEVRHAFLPPAVEEEAAIVASYPPEVLEFVRGARPLVVANAFKIVFREGRDLYGLDMCVRLTAQLKKDYPEARLLFALAEAGDAEYLSRMRREADALGVGESVYFMTGQRELWPLIKRADLFVRPTVSDGYAVSVAEARYFGRPVVASDAAPRPAGVLTFRTRDDADFRSKCLAALEGSKKTNVDG